MRIIEDRLRPDTRADQLLILLPPALSTLDDLIDQGFVAAVRARALPLDLQLAETGYAQVMAGTMAADLERELIAPARRAGYRTVRLAGISLGGFNALTHAASGAAPVDSLTLIAPYPGTADILAEIRAGGGPRAWAADPAHGLDDERRWWHWLATRSSGQAPALHLALGNGDRFADGQRMMAGLVAAHAVDRIDGDHSWPVWLALWQRWLDRLVDGGNP